MKITAVTVALCFNLQAASAKTYYCTLTDVLTLSDEGELVSHPLRDIVLGYQVTVEAETGKVFHPEFGTSSYDFIEVLDYGSAISAFKVIAYSSENSRHEEGVSGYRNASYFEMKTYVEGPSKPFMAQTATNFGYGVCQ